MLSFLDRNVAEIQLYSTFTNDLELVRETALLLPGSAYSEEPLSTRGYGGAIVKDKEGNVVASVNLILMLMMEKY